ncbi:RloB family protein [Lacticaseibacillus paracasei]|uniref:RloB family protein n=1 Tax=Lacticaseibacillus paracasei TaxID=1597 RepID=UPI00124B4BB5|nr:RloB family protein [Lacticaseibacillus paracasei]KAB1963544.1 RloB domain-containing protein [Lacticaseibacillus paracasei]MCT3331711.1 RloB domain-containing protein [Lacticaseibacillus paracasei]
MGRKSKGIPVKKIIAIYCEGDSEKQYFEMLKRKYHSTNIHVHSERVTINSVGENGLPLLKKAKKKFSRLPKSQQAEKVYAVFDRDYLSKADLNDCINFAKQNDISIILSSVNLEIWILMHFQDVTKSYTANQLNSILSGRDFFNTDYCHFKGKPYDEFLDDRVKLAKDRADLLEKNYKNPWYYSSPCTNMNRAIVEIFGRSQF